MSIEFYSASDNPFFTSNQLKPIYHRSLSSGRANIKYDNIIIVTEDTPLFPLLSHSFVRVLNRERKLLIAVDLAHVEHINPQQISSDGTNTLNQSGDSSETYLKPPSSLVTTFRSIEFYKKDTFDKLGSVNDTFSPISYPEASRSDMRQIRLDFENLRISNPVNPGSRSLKIGQLYNSNDLEAFKFLIMSPDMDYPEENEMIILNLLFDDTENGVNIFDTSTFNIRASVWPEHWKINTGQSGLTDINTPEVKESSIEPLLNVISIPTAKFPSDTAPSITSEKYPFWNMLGIYKVFEGTSEAERGSKNRYRYDFNRVELAIFNNYTQITDHSGIDAEDLRIDEEYFYNMDYSHKSSEDHLLWETDEGTAGNSWVPFTAGGYVDISAIGDRIRHKLENDLDEGRNYIQSNYDLRFSQGSDDDGLGYFVWSDWEYTNILIDYDDSEKITSNTTIKSNPGDQDEQYFRVELGRKGGRDKAFVLDFIKTNSTFEYNLKLDILLNRKVFKGDILKYEILIDSLSVDNKFYIDIEYYNTGLSGSTSFLSSAQTIFNSNQTEDFNRWHKVEIPLNLIEGKYIKYIVFRGEESNSVLGRCLAYFNEIQILNIVDQFNGRQFVSTINYSRNEIKDNTDPHGPEFSQAYKPLVLLVGYLSDRFGNIVDHKISSATVDDIFDDQDNNIDNILKWFISVHSLPYSRFLNKVAIFYGIPKTLEYSPGLFIGPEPGGTFNIERASLFPTNAMDFILSYSTDDWESGNINDPVTGFVDYSELGYKAWALQLRSKYVEI